MTNISGLVPCVCLFLRFGGRSFYVNLVTWSIFWHFLVRIPGTMNLCHFDLGGFIPLGLVEVFLVVWIVWMVVSPRDMGVHFFLSPPDYGTVGWMLLYLGWVQSDVRSPGVDGLVWPIDNRRNALIWVRLDALYFVSSYLTIISDLSQLLFVSDNRLSLASRGPSIRC